MANRATKTEHTGAKNGRGAYWGPRADAKKESDEKRRKDSKAAIDEALTEKNIFENEN